MRLTETEVSVIKGSVHYFDPNAKVYLFGSRVDDKKRGGDIDLFILSNKIKSSERRKIKLKIYDKVGEQKIDIVVTPKPTTTFHKIALSEGVLL
ncbi:MAG: nucleotidyltransferase domain-containing protein [bacterium]|nr:nucleotidyltransferase domain-containing protein [bacterium]